MACIWQLFSLKMTTATILSEILRCHFVHLAQLITTVILFSAWNKSRVKWDNSQNSRQKMRTYVILRLLQIFLIGIFDWRSECNFKQIFSFLQNWRIFYWVHDIFSRIFLIRIYEFFHQDISVAKENKYIIGQIRHFCQLWVFEKIKTKNS